MSSCPFNNFSMCKRRLCNFYDKDKEECLIKTFLINEIKERDSQKETASLFESYLKKFSETNEDYSIYDTY